MTVHLGAGTLIENESGEILLIQEGKEHVKGKWNLPSGGYAKEDEDHDETIEQAAIRETREETGLEVQLKGLIGIYTRDADRTDAKNTLILFEAEKTGGKIEPDAEEEILDAKYVSIEEIREFETRFDLDTILDDFKEKGSQDVPVRPLEF
ncbi:MAG: NUDIX hydrolase [Candidatus Nanohaloarchaea archaeon]